ncbi:unnamed protein product [Rotaria sp. Silwood1]|nr:unnamed protein product [Rotaria sp. Silwood1]
MYRYLIILASIICQITCDCLYPEWKKTCQNYCMDNQLYEIQLNQCYSMNPNQLTCKCSGKDLTEKIKNMIENNDSKLSSLIPSSTILSTIHGNEICIPSYSCTIGKIICHGIDAYCSCDNGTWISISCPKGKLCSTVEGLGGNSHSLSI